MDSHNTADSSDSSGKEGRQSAEGDVVDWTSLSGFQRDLLVSLSRIEETGNPPSGSDLREDMSDRYGEPINHGRLYQNLDRLDAKGVIEKSFLDGRTNAYHLTDDGSRLLRDITDTFRGLH